MDTPNKRPETAEPQLTHSLDDQRSGRPSRVDEMSEASFPASDAPAVWTWDPPPSR